jgi:hypothetical protein
MSNKISDLTIYRTAAAAIDVNQYLVDRLDFESSTVLVFTRKAGVLKREKFVASVKRYWPKLSKTFDVPVRELVVVDYDFPFGGGPLADYVVGVYSSDTVEPKVQRLIKETAGWGPQPSTMDYIKVHYAHFEDPEQAYIDDMVIHEMGHVYFGFGRTRAPKSQNDWWFLLGMGLIYDRAVWTADHLHPSPAIGATEKLWRNTFSKKKNLDQRLVNPDTSKDAQFGLNRLQIYGHGKSIVFLRALREELGTKEFDLIVDKYLKDGEGRTITYDDFLTFVPSERLEKVRRLEKKFFVR